MDKIDRFTTTHRVILVKELIDTVYMPFNEVWNDDYTVTEDYANLAILAVLCNAGTSPVSICHNVVVQGSMLITTLRLFVENSIPFTRNRGKEKVFFRDLNKKIQKEFLHTGIPVTYIDKQHKSPDELVQYFYMSEYSWYKSKLFRNKVANAISAIGNKRGIKV